MSALDQAAAFIAAWEGRRLRPYQDQGGVWTIGYGATRIAGRPVTSSTPGLTADGALALLQGDVGRFLDQVRKLLRVPLSDAQLVAVGSLAFNIGVGAFGGSTLLKLLNAGQVRPAADEFPKWNRVKGRVNSGLIRRRAAERALFLGADAPPAPTRPKVSVTPEAWLSEADLLNIASLARAKELLP